MKRIVEILNWKPLHTWLLAGVLLIGGSYVNYRVWEGERITLGGHTVTAFRNTLEENSTGFVPTQYAVNKGIAKGIEAGIAEGIAESMAAARFVGNAYEVINIRDFRGITPDARVLRNEDTARGTDATPALEDAIDAALPGQTVLVGPGEWLFATPLKPFRNKQINLVILGNTHHNKRDFIRISAPAGADRQHRIYHYGTAFGRENMPTHSKFTHDRGTQPRWQQMKNVFIRIVDCDKNYMRVNKVEGFGAAVQIEEDQSGSQENTFVGQFLYKNAVGISLKSNDGTGYIDKNTFTGPDGGVMRISGGLGLHMDGYAGKAKNGEIYNCAMRKNTFRRILWELLDSVAVMNGDITEPIFDDCVVEGGTNFGVFGPVVYQLRSVAPNYVRTPVFHNCGYISTEWFPTGWGIDGKFTNTPFYHRSSLLLGMDAVSDGSGNLTILCKSSVPASVRAAVPENVRFLNAYEPEIEVTIIRGAYTVSPGVRYVYYDHKAGTVTLPDAPSFPTRQITVINRNNNPLRVANVVDGGTSTVHPKKAVTYRSDGKSWYPLDDGASTVGTLGAFHRENNADLRVSKDDYSCFIEGQSADRTIILPDPAMYPNRVLIVGQRRGGQHAVKLSHTVHTGEKEGMRRITGNSSYMIQSDGVNWQMILAGAR